MGQALAPFGKFLQGDPITAVFQQTPEERQQTAIKVGTVMGATFLVLAGASPRVALAASALAGTYTFATTAIPKGEWEVRAGQALALLQRVDYQQLAQFAMAVGQMAFFKGPAPRLPMIKE